jgi:hypothetical protein
VNHPCLVTTISSLGLALLLPACKTIESQSTVGSRMAVAQDGVPCYRHVLLQKGDVVTVRRKEFAYSLVQLRDGQEGYVANDDLVPASPAAGGPSDSSESAPVRKVVKVRKHSSSTAHGATSSDVPPLPSFRY